MPRLPSEWRKPKTKESIALCGTNRRWSVPRRIVAVDETIRVQSERRRERTGWFYSRYYQPIPWYCVAMVQGQVTAAGVFSDVMRTLVGN